MSSTPRTRIEVIAHGPYEVTGDVELSTIRIIRSERGEPLTWRTEQTDAGAARETEDGAHLLCRCGHSRDKPYCDGSHAFELFDGTEDAPADTFDERAETHVGHGITVYKDGRLCQHAQFCKYVDTNWFELIPETDDVSRRSQLVAMIERCPSGALAYEIDDQRIEPALPVRIAAVVDGPLLVTGGIPVTRADGTPMEVRNRVTLCRCGGSKSKPLCDGSHQDNGFRS